MGQIQWDCFHLSRCRIRTMWWRVVIVTIHHAWHKYMLNKNSAFVVGLPWMRSMWKTGQLSQNAFLISRWSWVNECVVCSGQSSELSCLLYVEGCGYSLLRAGMTSVWVGCVTWYFIVNLGGVCVTKYMSVCSCPLPVAVKCFPGKGCPCWHSCRIVVFSLRLEFSVWGRRRGDWLAALQETWASAYWKKKKRAHWLQLLCGTRGATAPAVAQDASPDLGVEASDKHILALSSVWVDINLTCHEGNALRRQASECLPPENMICIPYLSKLLLIFLWLLNLSIPNSL